MRLRLNVYKAVQDYREYIKMVRKSKAFTDEECDEMLSLERFAIWLENEYPQYCEAVTK